MKNYLALTCFVFVAACTAPHKGNPAYEQSYVSATSNEQEYVSALNAAMEEYAEERMQSQALAVGTPEKTLPATHVTRTTRTAYTSDLWREAPLSEGEGLVLADDEAQVRLNDALQTTPSGSKAGWESAGLTITVIPNSPLYTPYHSGGRCRDAVVAIHGDGFYDEAKRGLFCQQGNGSAWLLQLP